MVQNCDGGPPPPSGPARRYLNTEKRTDYKRFATCDRARAENSPKTGTPIGPENAGWGAAQGDARGNGAPQEIGRQENAGSIMSDTAIYLDANASMPLRVDSRAAMVAALDLTGNASSTHAAGRAGRRIIEDARRQVAALAGATARNVVFTSGATEAANMALTPDWQIAGQAVRIGHLYVGATEHACVRAGGGFAADRITVVPVCPDGRLDRQALKAALAAHDHSAGPPLVATMLANNETGVIHPVADIAQIVKDAGGVLFCDAVQAAGRIPVEMDGLGAHAMALSGHKLGGPQGVGALVLAAGDCAPAPLIRGGGQEMNRRGGTQNIAAIAGFGVAAAGAAHDMAVMESIAVLRDRLEAGILDLTPDVSVAGAGAGRLANTSLMVRPAVPAETVVIAFDLEGIAVSAGAACSSGTVEPSHVLRAMGYSPDEARCGIRMSLNSGTTETEIDRTLAVWRKICRKGSGRHAA